MIAQCAECEKEFEKKADNQRFCGESCRNESKNHRKHRNLITQCAVCEKEFKKKTENQKFCSPACATIQYNNNLTFKKKPKLNECEACGNVFERTGRQKTCSKACARIRVFEKSYLYERSKTRKEAERRRDRVKAGKKTNHLYEQFEARKEAERQQAHRVELYQLCAIHRAAKFLGIPPMIYAAMKFRDSFNQFPNPGGSP